MSKEPNQQADSTTQTPSSTHSPQSEHKLSIVYYRIALIILVLSCLLLGIDRMRMNMRFNRVADRILEKTQIIADNESLYQQTLDVLNNSLQDSARCFRITSHAESALSGTVFDHPFSKSEDKKTVENLRAKIKRSHPLDVRTVLHQWLTGDPAPQNEIRIHPDNAHISDRLAAICEEVCRQSGLLAKTTIHWNMKYLKRRVSLAISDPKHPEIKEEHLSFGEKADPAFEVVQNDWISVVFPFHNVELLSLVEKEIIPPRTQLPLGTLYAHSFRAFSKGAWYLEYEFPDGLSPAECNLKVLSLVPGSSVTSRIDGNIQSFRIQPTNNESLVLLTADRPFFPKRVTAVPAGAKRISIESATNDSTQDSSTIPGPSSEPETKRRDETISPPSPLVQPESVVIP